MGSTSVLRCLTFVAIILWLLALVIEELRNLVMWDDAVLLGTILHAIHSDWLVTPHLVT